MEQYDKVISNFNKAIELEPNYAEAYNNRGNAYGFMGIFDKGTAYISYAFLIQADPDSRCDAPPNRETRGG